MTILDRVLTLLEKYDDLAASHYESRQYLLGYDILMNLRKENLTHLRTYRTRL